MPQKDTKCLPHTCCGPQKLQTRFLSLAVILVLGALLYLFRVVTVLPCIKHGSACSTHPGALSSTVESPLRGPGVSPQDRVIASDRQTAVHTRAPLPGDASSLLDRGGFAQQTSPSHLLAEGKASQGGEQLVAVSRSQGGDNADTPSSSKRSADVPPRKLAFSMNRSLAETVANVQSKDKVVIVVSANSGYLDFLRNWFVSVERFGYGRQVVFLAEEAQAFAALEREHPGQAVLLAGDDVEADAQSFETDAYYKIVDRRPAYLEAILNLNVALLYNDVDMVWLEDPFPHLRGDYDVWVTNDYFLDLGEAANAPVNPPLPRPASSHNLCTCFMYIRPTPGSRRLIRKWQQVIRQRVARSKGFVKNQPAFNHALHLCGRQRGGTAVRLGVLPQRLFPPGNLVFRNVTWRRDAKARGVKPVVIHNNWATGHKKKLWRFKLHKLWFADPADDRTASELQHDVDVDAKELAVVRATEAGELAFR